MPALVGADAALLDAIAATWLSGSSLPALCDPAFAALESAGRITPALTWKRVALAVESGNAGLLRHLAGKLPDADAAQVRAWAGFLETPDDDARRWRAHPLAAAVAVRGLAQLAEHDPGRAAKLLAQLSTPLALDASQRGMVLNAIALWSAASYLPDAAKRFDAVPGHVDVEALRDVLGGVLEAETGLVVAHPHGDLAGRGDRGHRAALGELAVGAIGLGGDGERLHVLVAEVGAAAIVVRAGVTTGGKSAARDEQRRRGSRDSHPAHISSLLSV